MIPDTSEITVEQIPAGRLSEIESLNLTIFNEARIINRTNHRDMVILKARIMDIPIGFKVGYGKLNGVFYSAKGGVLPIYRRQGVAQKMLDMMMDSATVLGYREFQYDTFPNMDKGMLFLGLNRGFKIIEAKWNAQYKDFQLTLMKEL